jgi:hypothetical protein
VEIFLTKSDNESSELGFVAIKEESHEKEEVREEKALVSQVRRNLIGS